MTLRIHFQRTGGFAGAAARRSCTVDAGSLPAPEAGELRDLVQAADVAALASHESARSASARPDAFRYRLVVDSGGEQHTLEFGDSDLPASLRPLVSWLTKRAAPG
jgi:hypothetical protein